MRYSSGRGFGPARGFGLACSWTGSWAIAPVLLASCALIACSGEDDGSAGGGGKGGSSSTSGGKSGSSGSGNTSGGKSGSGPVSSDFPDAQTFVDAHNAVRAAVEEPAGYSGTWQAVPKVTWSDAVAQTAQAWADHLKSTQDCGLEHAQGTGYGENLAAGSNLDAERAVGMWASEGDEYSYQAKYAFDTNTGHYTQIVWRGTERIGCASAACARSTVVVCRYDPPGNYIGQQIY